MSETRGLGWHCRSRVSNRRSKFVSFLRLPLGSHCKDVIPKIQTNIPRKGIVRPQSPFPHSCVCERCIYSQDRSAYSTDTWMWKLGRRPSNFFFWKYINGIFVAMHVITKYIYKFHICTYIVTIVRVRVEGPIQNTSYTRSPTQNIKSMRLLMACCHWAFVSSERTGTDWQIASGTGEPHSWGNSTLPRQTDMAGKSIPASGN